MLSSEAEGNKKIFKANTKHPLFENMHHLVMKYVGLDRIVEKITERLGDVEAVYLVGDYAQGIDSGIIDLFIVAENLNTKYFVQLLMKVESEINRKIRYIHFKESTELSRHLNNQGYLLLWEK